MEAVLDRHIELTPGIRGGRARITGTRLAVADIVTLHLRLNRSLEEIAGKYQVTLADVYAAMAYFYDHRAAIEADMKAGEAYADAFLASHPSVLRGKFDTGDDI